MNTGNGKRQNSTFSPTQTSAGSPPPPGYRPGGVAGDPTALPFRPQTPPGRRLPATAPTAGPAAMLGAAGQTPRASPPPLPPGALRGLCAWLDGLPLSRPKRHLARDFSDGGESRGEAGDSRGCGQGAWGCLAGRQQAPRKEGRHQSGGRDGRRGREGQDGCTAGPWRRMNVAETGRLVGGGPLAFQHSWGRMGAASGFPPAAPPTSGRLLARPPGAPTPCSGGPCDRSPRSRALPGSPAMGDGCVRKGGALSSSGQPTLHPLPPPVMLAEIVKHFRPHLVDLHNYVPTCNTDQKLSNWSILNRQASRLPACPVGAPALLCEDPALKAGLGGRPLPYPPGLWDKLSGCFPVRVCPPVPWGLPISTDSQGLPAKRTWPAPVSHSAGRQSGSC